MINAPQGCHVWSHFSPVPFVLDETKDINGITASGKRGGLWLSDESTPERSCTWSEWCIDQQFELEKLAFKTDITLEMKDIYVVDGTDLDDMQRFHDNYYSKFGAPTGYWIELARQGYKGFAITPYDRFPHIGTLGYVLMASWYLSWDCASAVIWDYSCIHKIGTPEAFEAPSKDHLSYYMFANESGDDNQAQGG